MKWTFSTQKLQTFLCGLRSRFSVGGGMGCCQVLLKGDVFRVDVARRFLAMSGRGRHRRLDGLGRGRLRLAARLEELDLGGVDFGGLSLLAILAFPGTGLQ